MKNPPAWFWIVNGIILWLFVTAIRTMPISPYALDAWRHRSTVEFPIWFVLAAIAFNAWYFLRRRPH